MGTIVFLLTIAVFLAGMVTLFLYKHKPKFLWIVPVAAIIVSGCLVLKDISLYTTSEPTIARKLAHYFHNDVSMGLYLIYVPITGIAVIVTIIAYVAYFFNHYRRKLDKKK
jgi:hypothetical protein